MSEPLTTILPLDRLEAAKALLADKRGQWSLVQAAGAIGTTAAVLDLALWRNLGRRK